MSVQTEINRINNEVTSQADLIAQIQTALEGKAAGSASLLPEGYTQLEYIESSGTQYIDTGFKPNQDTGVTIDFQLNSASDWQCVFGTRVGANTASYSLWHSGTAFGFYYASVNTTWGSLAGTARHSIVATKNTAVADGTNSVSLTYSNFSTNYPLFLFAANTSGEAESIASMRLYSCQIYDNGTLVRDFVPCTNASGVAGLYDLVNDVFYGNAGSGAFKTPFSSDPVLLWTNASPNSSFGAQSVSVNGAGYSSYLVELRDQTSNTTYGVWVISKSVGSYKMYFDGPKNRQITSMSDSAIAFSRGIYGSYSDTVCIPTRIWGVKFTL